MGASVEPGEVERSERARSRRGPLGKVRFGITMSLDGFIAGPRQSVKDPLGVGGARLHLEQVEAIEAPGVTHLRYRVSR